MDTGHTVFDELDIEITIKEISDAIGHLKRGKSHGLDYVLNEYFIEYFIYRNKVVKSLSLNVR